ncbi:DUF4388 domain-containing protein [candidate division WOR-3 bacterium]|nr:DUF4388 domain-containing protein [candidate division WOR-3 bacterium]
MIYHNILLVHKASEQMDKLSRTLSNVGHNIEVTHSARDALQKAKKEKPTVIIASDDLSGPDVFEFCTEIKNKNGSSPYNSRFLILVKRESAKTRDQAIKCGADEYLTATATLPVLVERINAFLKDDTDTAASDLSGSIAHSGLIDILQLIEFSAKNGVLNVSSGMRQGNMTFCEGQLISANTNDKHKEAAVYEMLSWEEGEFIFKTQPVDNTKSRLAPISSLVLEWARVKDESSKSAQPPASEPRIETPPEVTKNEPVPETADESDTETESEEPGPHNWASRLNSWLGYLREDK